MNHVEIKRRQIQICSLILGLITVWILGKRIGDNGIAYLAAALEICVLVWTLISGQLSDTLGKMLRMRYSKGQYKNASKMKRCIVIFQGILGILCGVIIFAAAQFLAETVLNMPYSKFLIMLIVPIFFLRTISDFLLGIFQGEGSELPSAIACVLRQLLILGFGQLFSRILVGYGEKVSSLLGQDAFTAMYGAVGVVAAILLAEVLVLLFLALVYKGSDRKRRKKEPDGMKTTDSFVRQVYALYSGMPVLQGVLEVLPLLIGYVLFRKSVADVNTAAEYYGVYFGKYFVFCGSIMLLLVALIIPLTVKSAGLFRKDDHRYARDVFQSGLKSVFAYALFFVVFIAVMANQLAGAVSSTYVDLLAEMLAKGSGIIFFGMLAFLCMTILKLLGKKLLVIGCLAVSDIVFIVVLMLGINVWNAGIMALVYAGLAGCGVLAVSLCILTFGLLRTGIDWLRTVAVPVVSCCISGLLCHLLGKVFTPHLGNTVTLIVVFILALMLHWAIVLFLRCFREHEMDVIPGGRIMRILGQLLGAF